MPDKTDLRAAIDELADRAPAFDPAAVLDPVDRGQRHRSPRPMMSVAAAVVVVALIAVLVPLLLTRQDSTPATAPDCGGVDVSAHACAVALAAAHSWADQSAEGRTSARTGWPSGIRLVTIGVHKGSVRYTNAGPPCTSGRVLLIEEFGRFDAVSGGIPLPPGQHPGLQLADVIGLSVTADAKTGRPCVVEAYSASAPITAGQSAIFPRHKVAVRGTFIRSGGPVGTPNIPLSGRIEVYGSGKAVVAVGHAGSDGTFEISLPPGRYVFGGITPRVSGVPCESSSAVTVGRGRNNVQVICSIP